MGTFYNDILPFFLGFFYSFSVKNPRAKNDLQTKTPNQPLSSFSFCIVPVVISDEGVEGLAGAKGVNTQLG
jgi:hypothetical protein